MHVYNTSTQIPQLVCKAFVQFEMLLLYHKYFSIVQSVNPWIIH